MRNALAKTLYELAKQDDRIVVLVADISPAGAMEDFRRDFPARFINVGVAEQSMIMLAAGLAMRGFKPFCYTIATFALFRPYEFIRCDLAYQNLPVTIVGMGAGLAYSTLGGTHQAIEDVAVAMACPNMTVITPCDPTETVECVRWCAQRSVGGPAYLRIGKVGEPDLGGNIVRVPVTNEWCRWLHLRTPASRKPAYLVLTYGPIATVALAVGKALDCDVLSISRLTPVLEQVCRLVSGYAGVLVVEETAGAPLGMALRGIFEGIEVNCYSLPREFHHVYGTREQLLAHHGLTAENILADFQTQQ